MIAVIEITYHTSDEAGENVVVKPPKNIRQIGSPRGRHKIYVEDYVHTYLHSTLLFGEDQQRAAILLGRSEVSQEIRYTFIEGAINCEDFVFQKDGIIFDESCWEYIYQEMKQYFDQQGIVGWFLGRPGFPLKISHTVEAAQRKYFSGRDKVLYLWDPEEGEDAFFAYEQGAFQKKEGYYVYYEKNLAMQEYMVCQKERTREAQGGIQEIREESSKAEELSLPLTEESGPAEKLQKETDNQTEAVEQDGADRTWIREEPGESSGEGAKWDMLRERVASARTSRATDTAIGNYRDMLKKRQKKQSAGGKNLFLYGAATVALIAICISGVVNLNSYQKMKQMEEVLLMISKPLEEQQAENQQDQRQITVQTVSGDVQRQEDASGASGENAGQGQEGAQQGAAGGQETGAVSDGQEGARPAEQPDSQQGTSEGQPGGQQGTAEGQPGSQQGTAEGQPGGQEAGAASGGQASAQPAEGQAKSEAKRS